MFPTRPPHRAPALDRDAVEHSLRAAHRNSRAPTTDVSPEEAAAVSRALQRRPYDEALAAGTIPPAPEDFTGWRIGGIAVQGPGTETGTWAVHNPRPSPGIPADYTISHETLLGCYALSEMIAPGA